MPPFCQRPTTYLFLGATAILIPAIAEPRSVLNWNVWAQGFTIGQMMLSGAWLVLGSTHRLARGAICLAATAGLAAVSCWLIGRLNLNAWQQTLAGVFMIQIVVAIGAAVALLALRRLESGSTEGSGVFLRYPVIEIFGWTIVVALASLLLRDATMTRLFVQWRSIIWLFGCTMAGASAAALHRSRVEASEISVMTVAALAFLAACFLTPADWDRNDFVHIGIGTAYVVAYCLCRRLDESLKQSQRELQEEEPTPE